ncbi:hypothetical protein T02_5398 [Trichinella nativa]|uniref:Uncharacterized protein n=1 Tax=Trichinella nativa TaxID=6335 RepID=A0A0V1LJE6_9BILA|nr:hypothetical protein T02_5398 [Trichinella nativa]
MKILLKSNNPKAWKKEISSYHLRDRIQTAENGSGNPAFQVGRMRPALLPKAMPASGSKYCPDIAEGPARLPNAMPPNGSK